MKAAAVTVCLLWLPLLLVFLTPASSQSTLFVSSAEAAENSWMSKAPMHEARSGLGVAVVNGKIYAIGGSTASGFMPSIPGSAVLGNRDIGGHVGTNEEYDPATNKWTYKASMPTPRIVFAIAAYQNKIYCIGARAYSVSSVPLTFAVNKPTSWIGYSLDGLATVTIAGNTTLTGLSDGSHSLIVYAKDAAGNTGASEIIYFSIKTFPITWIVVAITMIAIGGVASLVYFRKIKKTTGKAE